MTGTWFKAASVDDVERDSVRQVHIGGHDIALYRCGDYFYASGNICPHAYALLSDGFLEGFEIECPLHGARFDCRTGESLSGPADEDLRTFPVRINGDAVEIDTACAAMGNHAAVAACAAKGSR